MVEKEVEPGSGDDDMQKEVDPGRGDDVKKTYEEVEDSVQVRRRGFEGRKGV